MATAIRPEPRPPRGLGPEPECIRDVRRRLERFADYFARETRVPVECMWQFIAREAAEHCKEHP